ncbi:MAG: hypothetical protein KKD39_06830, partial [Candidatus Altiarchaeota archaeon]|nr:hypothetical protein [Candidatus Altiarchaeota archaeon]
MASVMSAGVVRDVLVESLGKDHISVLEKLSEPRYDEDVAEELGMKATIVRTLLNDLHDNRLVEYQRTKNKKTGWYTYMWIRREDKLTEYVQNYIKTQLTELNSQLSDENGNVTFQCDCMHVPYETALEADFACVKCKGQFVECDNNE